MSKALDFYLDLCSSGAIEKDQNQIDLLTELEIFLSNSDKNIFSKIFKFSSQENSLICFYLHGNVGSGKTLLMDLISKVIKGLSKNGQNNSKIEKEVQKEVIDLCSSFPIYSD